jgi:hypothetical protein
LFKQPFQAGLIAREMTACGAQQAFSRGGARVSNAPKADAALALLEGVEKTFRRFEIGGIEPFGKAAEDWRE